MSSLAPFKCDSAAVAGRAGATISSAAFTAELAASCACLGSTPADVVAQLAAPSAKRHAMITCFMTPPHPTMLHRHVVQRSFHRFVGFAPIVRYNAARCDGC